VTLADGAGLIGAALILLAFALVQARRLDPHKAAALLMNLLGAGLVMASLAQRFNLAAFLLEAAWALVALWGLVRLAAARIRRR
jgi:membrane-bound ClpP family serine protease